jgi:hypothetical protein
VTRRAGSWKPPKGLRAPTRCWVESVVEAYELEGHHLHLLGLAAQALDREQKAREAIAKNGLTFQDRFGAPKPRPEVAIARDAAVVFARLLRELRLDVDPDDARAPGLGGGRGRA